MVNIDLGKIKLTNKGAWVNTTAYEVDDFVNHQGHSFVCIADNTGEDPYDTATGINSNWDWLAKGADEVIEPWRPGRVKGAWLANSITNDASFNQNDLTLAGTLTEEPVASGAALNGYTGFTSDNHISLAIGDSAKLGTGDFCFMGWMKAGTPTGTEMLFDMAQPDGLKGRVFGQVLTDGTIRFGVNTGAGIDMCDSATSMPADTWAFGAMIKYKNKLQIYVNGVLDSEVDLVNALGSVDNIDAVLRFGTRYDGQSAWTTGSMTLVRLLDYAPTDGQLLQVYEEELGLFVADAPFSVAAFTDPLMVDTDRNGGNNPLKVRAFSKVTGNYGSQRNACVLMEDGKAKAWGTDDHGAHGTGDYTGYSRHLPVTTGIPKEAGRVNKLISAYESRFAIMDDGDVYGWGYNGYGALGQSHASNRYYPVKVPLSGKCVDIVIGSGGYYTSAFVLFLLEDGTIQSTGYNGWGQLGDGSTSQRTAPVNVIGLTGLNVVSITSGGDRRGHSFATLDNGDVYAWGNNDDGQLGLGDTSNRTAPTKVTLPAPCIQVQTVGVNWSDGTDAYTFFVLDNGDVYATGNNNSYQLGLGHTTQQNSPVKITQLSNVAKVQSGGNDGSAIALLSDGTVRTWGDGSYGNLGNGSTSDKSTPYNPGVSGVRDIYKPQTNSKYLKTVLMMDDGSVMVAGYNDNGNLGIGHHGSTQSTFTHVIGLGDENIVDVSHVGPNSESSLMFLTEGGDVLTTGYNGNGQLGFETNDNNICTPNRVQL